jgi:IS4 transposase
MKGKKRKSESAFIRGIRKMIPEQYRIVIIGDREFAGKEFIRNILRIKDTDVVIRIKKNTNVTDHGNLIRLREHKKSLSDCFYGENRGIIYIDNNDDKVTVFGSIRNIGLVKRFYEKRMGIEEMFRDMKTGLGLKKIRTKNRIRFKNLTAFSLLAYLVIVIADRRLKGKNEYFSYFQTVLYSMIICPLLIRQFSLSEFSETDKLSDIQIIK